MFYKYYLEIKKEKENILNRIPISYDTKRKPIIKEIRMLALETS